MTALPTTATAGAGTPAQAALWRVEFLETLKLASPLAVTQLGQIAMMTTDLALLGRLGDQVVAAAALSHTVLFAAFTLGMGLMSAVAPLASQAFGARNPRFVRRSVRVGLWAAVLAGVPLTALQFWGEEILLALGQSPESAELAGRYLLGLSWCLIPAWIFMALRNFMSAVNRPEPALWITLAAIPINGVLAYALIYGAFGAPRLDVLGAGLATTLVNVFMCAVAIWIAYTRRPFKKYRVLGRFWRFDWQLFRQLLVIGLPISGSFLLEYGLFAAAALLMGSISTSAIAAHQIALQTAAVLYMVPFGISLAATVRVGQAVGRRDGGATRRAGFTAMILAVAFMVVMTVVVAFSRHSIPLLFLGDSRRCGRNDCLGRNAAGSGRNVLHHRWGAIRGRRRLARIERYAGSAADRGLQFLDRRLCKQLRLGLFGGAWCRRCLDWPVARHRRLCRAAALALSCADACAVHAGRAGCGGIGV